MVSKKCPSASGPSRFPTANAIRYSGVVLGRDPVELAQHQRGGEEDRVVEERLRDHHRGAEDRSCRVLAEEHAQQGQVAVVLPGLDVDGLALVDGRQLPAGLLLDLVLHEGDRLLGLVGAAVHDLPPRALRQVPPDEDDHDAENRADREADPPGDARFELVEQDEGADVRQQRAEPVGPVDHDVDAAAVLGRDQLVDGRVDRRVLAADAHPGDEPRGVEEDQPAHAVAEVSAVSPLPTK